MRKNGNLDKKNERLIYANLIRNIITWSRLKTRPPKPLEVFQNKILRLILNRNRYSPVKELQGRIGIEMIENYLYRISFKFYGKTSYVSDVVNKTTITRQNARNQNGKLINTSPSTKDPPSHSHKSPANHEMGWRDKKSLICILKNCYKFFLTFL